MAATLAVCALRGDSDESTVDSVVRTLIAQLMIGSDELALEASKTMLGYCSTMVGFVEGLVRGDATLALTAALVAPDRSVELDRRASQLLENLAVKSAAARAALAEKASFLPAMLAVLAPRDAQVAMTLTNVFTIISGRARHAAPGAAATVPSSDSSSGPSSAGNRSRDSACVICGKHAGEPGVAKLQSCARCHSARYCSTACQRADWPAHKAACRHA